MDSVYQIGHCPIVVVSKQTTPPQAVITSIVVEYRNNAEKPSVHYLDQDAFSKETRNQIETVLLRIIHKISEGLTVPVGSFEFSLTNVSAASAFNQKICLNDCSADLPLFFAMLSAWLRLPLSQEAVMTGHLASLDGEIRAVQFLAEKMKAAFQSNPNAHFICPSVKADDSLPALAPRTLESLEGAILQAKINHRVSPVQSIANVLPLLVTEEQIVLSGLKCNYFEESPDPLGSPDSVARCTAFLLQDNHQRYLQLLRKAFMKGKQDLIKGLLEERIGFQRRMKRYPSGLGMQLQNILLSLPANILQRQITFPILPVRGLYILSEYGLQESDQKDLYYLIHSVLQPPLPKEKFKPQSQEFENTENYYDFIVDYLMTELYEDNLFQKFGLTIESARMGFGSDQVIVENNIEFEQLYVAYYIHLMNRVHLFRSFIDPDRSQQEAYGLLERAFRQQGGAKEAYREALCGTGGGMHLVYQRMTDQYKQERYNLYKEMILLQIIDPLEWEPKVLLSESIKRKLAPILSADLRAMTKEELAHNWQFAIQCALGFEKQFNDRMRSI